MNTYLTVYSQSKTYERPKVKPETYKNNKSWKT